MDGTPTAFLVRYPEWCSKCLCDLFKKSLSRAEVPDGWEYAKVTAIPKSEKKVAYHIVQCDFIVSDMCKKHIIFQHISVFLKTTISLIPGSTGFGCLQQHSYSKLSRSSNQF